MSTPALTLAGDAKRPVLLASFPRGATMPARPRLQIQHWVHKKLVDRVWDPKHMRWEIFGLGTSTPPEKMLEQFGLDLIWEEPDEGEPDPFGDARDLDDLWRPLLEHTGDGEWLVYPRLSGPTEITEALGPGAGWVKALGAFRCDALDLLTADLGATVEGIRASQDQLALLQEQAHEHLRDWRDADLLELAAPLAGSNGKEPGLMRRITAVGARTGDLFEDFGLELWKAQLAGVYAMAAGYPFQADDPGTGKTRMALGVANLLESRRLLLVVPPSVMGNWAAEAQPALEPGFAQMNPGQRAPLNGSGKPHGDSRGAYVQILGSKKWPESLPEVGVVIVSDSMRADVADRALEVIRQWGPDTVVFDEVHRYQTWWTDKATLARRFARMVPRGRSFPMSGTPMLANPAEMAMGLELAGVLGPVFGGHRAFMEDFTSPTPFAKRRPRKGTLDRLGRQAAGVWVRRTKEEMNPGLPPKYRGVKRVEVDLTEHELAMDELYVHVEQWAQQFWERDRDPSWEDAVEFARDKGMALSSRLRLAAGLCKVAPALEIIRAWHDEHGSDRPLVVWIHHQQVGKALVDGISEFASVSMISGTDTPDRRHKMVDRFQKGLDDVAVCAISAAGFGLTMTRSCDVIFVESDWTPSKMGQAEDRVHRIGQTRPVFVTTLFAPGSMDEHMRKVLSNKVDDLGPVLPGSDLSVTEVTGRLSSAGQIEGAEGDPRVQERSFSDVLAAMVMGLLEDPPAHRRVEAARERIEARRKSRSR